MGVGGVPATDVIRSADSAGPRLGFNTWKTRLPGSSRSTLAVNCEPLTKVVGTGLPLTSNCAPVMNFWPVRVTPALPTLNDDGVAEKRMGMGFITAMFCSMDTLGLSPLGMVG